MQTLTKVLTTLEVKTFVSDHPETVEKNINEWLQLNSVMVQHVGQSQSERNGRFVFVITIFYTRK
jgi:hypothetical protein